MIVVSNMNAASLAQIAHSRVEKLEQKEHPQFPADIPKKNVADVVADVALLRAHHLAMMSRGVSCHVTTI
jgi:hypothetical protein